MKKTQYLSIISFELSIPLTHLFQASCSGFFCFRLKSTCWCWMPERKKEKHTQTLLFDEVLTCCWHDALLLYLLLLPCQVSKNKTEDVWRRRNHSNLQLCTEIILIFQFLVKQINKRAGWWRVRTNTSTMDVDLNWEKERCAARFWRTVINLRENSL